MQCLFTKSKQDMSSNNNCELYLPNVWLLFRRHFTQKCGTSAKSFNGDVGMGCTMRKNKEIPLEILSRILAQLCVTPPYIFTAKVTHNCASILDSISKSIPCFHNFSHGASHPYIPIHSIERHLYVYKCKYHYEGWCRGAQCKK